jgi:hypothetical protein
MTVQRQRLLWLALLLAWAATRTAILCSVPSTEDETLHLYHGYASRVFEGEVPYRSFAVAYPPGAVLFFLLPRTVGASFPAYKSAFVVQLLVFDLALLYLASTAGGGPRLRLRAGLYYLGASFLLGPLLLRRFDLIPAALSVLSAALLYRRPVAAWVTLGLATSVKVYPAVFAVVLLFGERSSSPLRPLVLLRRGAAFVSGVLLGSLPLFLATGFPSAPALLVQTQRGLQVESVWATPFVLARLLGRDIRIVFRTGAFDVTGPHTAACATLSGVLVVLALGVFACWVLVLRRPRAAPTGDAADLRSLAPVAVSALGILLVLSKVLSPQFLLWILPWVAVLEDQGSRRPASVKVLFLVAALLTTWLFPYHYSDLVERTTLAAVSVLLLRNLLLVGFTVLEIRHVGARLLARTVPRPP